MLYYVRPISCLLQTTRNTRITYADNKALRIYGEFTTSNVGGEKKNTKYRFQSFLLNRRFTILVAPPLGSKIIRARLLCDDTNLHERREVKWKQDSGLMLRATLMQKPAASSELSTSRICCKTT
jgi:hypothetical protein